MANWYLWAFESIAIIRFARRFPLEEGRWKRHLPIQIGGAVIAALLMPVVGWPFDRWIGTRSASGGFGLYVIDHVPFNFTLYWITVAVSSAFESHRRARARELQASQLEARLAQTRLQVLQMQLHPHFLFNSLNAISALMHRDVQAADRMIARLGDLLRLTIENDGTQEVTLRKEIEFLEQYLEIMRVRFQDRLHVQLDISPETLDAFVPNLILQPLVENAIRHAISPRAEGGHVSISSCISDGRLELRVTDDGPGLRADVAGAMEKGLGLANTRARLEQLYGAMQRFVIQNRREGGVEVLLSAPLRTMPVRTTP